MATPIRYGRSLTISTEGQVITTTEKVFNNFSPVRQIQILTETIRIDDYNDAIAIFLNMIDEQKAGKIDQIGVQCLRDPRTGEKRVEKSWSVPGLQ